MLLQDTIAVALASSVAPPVPQRTVTRFQQTAWSKETSAHALILTGVRRSGKSTLKQQIRQQLGDPAALLQFEDTCLFGIGPEALGRCNSSLSFFDAEGMRFHLPAYLIAACAGISVLAWHTALRRPVTLTATSACFPTPSAEPSEHFFSTFSTTGMMIFQASHSPRT